MSRQKKILLMISWLSFLSLLFYFSIRLFIFFSNGHGWFNIIFSFLLLLAEAHSILHSLGFLIGIVNLRKTGANYHRRVELDKGNLPSVTILVPARNEPLEILEPTFIALFSLNYANKRLVFLDGSDDSYTQANKELADKYNIEYFSPLEKPRNKAEIINRYLPQVSSTYLTIFDADQNPLPDFLTTTISLAEYSDKIGFVQTPQLYSNLHVSPIARGAALQQSIFYENVCESKGAFGAMFCCGTNFLMRTAVLKEVGGFDEKSVTEDFATSVKMHSLGYQSIYYNHVSVFGLAPETLPAYLKQQFRWSAGSVGVLRKLFLAWLHGRLKLNFVQRWEYFLSATYYFVGWSFFILMICPALYLIFNVPSYFASPYLYLGTFIPYYVLMSITFYATMRRRNYRIKDVFQGIIMGSLSYPVLMKSTIAGILNRKLEFKVTDKGRTGKLNFWKLWPWTLMIAVNLLAISCGLFRFSENPYAIGINIVWCAYHLILLTNIFRLNQSPQAGKNNILHA